MSKANEIVSPQKKYTQAEVDVILQELEETKAELLALQGAVLGTFLEAERQRTRWSKVLIPELVALKLMMWWKNEYGLPEAAIPQGMRWVAEAFCRAEWPENYAEGNWEWEEL